MVVISGVGTRRFVDEAVATLGRRKKHGGAPGGVWLDTAPGMYPSYYRNDFHYQARRG